MPNAAACSMARSMAMFMPTAPGALSPSSTEMALAPEPDTNRGFAFPLINPSSHHLDDSAEF